MSLVCVTRKWCVIPYKVTPDWVTHLVPNINYASCVHLNVMLRMFQESREDSISWNRSHSCPLSIGARRARRTCAVVAKARISRKKKVDTRVDAHGFFFEYHAAHISSPFHSWKRDARAAPAHLSCPEVHSCTSVFQYKQLASEFSPGPRASDFWPTWDGDASVCDRDPAASRRRRHSALIRFSFFPLPPVAFLFAAPLPSASRELPLVFFLLLFLWTFTWKFLLCTILYQVLHSKNNFENIQQCKTKYSIIK